MLYLRLGNYVLQSKDARMLRPAERAHVFADLSPFRPREAENEEAFDESLLRRGSPCLSLVQDERVCLEDFPA